MEPRIWARVEELFHGAWSGGRGRAAGGGHPLDLRLGPVTPARP